VTRLQEAPAHAEAGDLTCLDRLNDATADRPISTGV